MFDSEEEDLFKPYEYNEEDLTDLCSTLMDTMNNDYSMGEIEFKVSKLSATSVEDNLIRVECSYDHDGGDESSVSFTIPSHVAKEPLEERMYDTIVEMA